MSEPFLALITPLTGQPGIPTHPIAPPPPGYPAHPIAPPPPGYPEHPIAPTPTPPDQIWPSPGHPAHPIVIPPPPGPDIEPPTPTPPPGPQGGWYYVPIAATGTQAHGWGYFPPQINPPQPPQVNPLQGQGRR